MTPKYKIYVKYCGEKNIPLEFTRSCCDNNPIHCGKCAMACVDRRLAFVKAGVKDKTKYRYPMPKEAEKKAKQYKSEK